METVQYFEKEIEAAPFVRDFRRPAEFMALCRQCGGYGRSWACPPFTDEEAVAAPLFAHSRVLLVAARVTAGEDLPIERAGELLRPVRLRMESELRRRERATGGRAYAFAGKCLYCPEAECARTLGEPCRHPGLVRPSLEAVGFDITLTLREIFGLELLWGRDGRCPASLTLAAALFHS